MPPKLTEEIVRERRERIIRAAAKLYVERGLTGTTLRAIAKRSGRSDPDFYRLFDDPLVDIPIAIFKNLWDQINSLVQKVAEDPNTNEREKLLFLHRAILDKLSDGFYGTIFVMESRQFNLGNAFLKSGLDRFAHLIDGIIKKGQRKGVFRSDLNPQAIRQQLIGCGENILLGWMWKARVPSYPARYTLKDACHIFEAILDGVSVKISRKDSSPKDKGDEPTIVQRKGS